MLVNRMKIGVIGLIGCLFMKVDIMMSQEKDSLIEKYAATITAEDAKAHLTFLADDLLEGRETGERGQKLAARYIRTHFMREGLMPGVPSEESYFQNYPFTVIEISEAELTIGKESFNYKSDFFFWGKDIPLNISDSWVFAG